jgi:hypothetical protein
LSPPISREKKVERIKTGHYLKFSRWDRFRGASGGSHQDKSQSYDGNGEYQRDDDVLPRARPPAKALQAITA